MSLKFGLQVLLESCYIYRFFMRQMQFRPDMHLFVCFVALRPKSTAMVIAGRSVHLATLFPGQA